MRAVWRLSQSVGFRPHSAFTKCVHGGFRVVGVSFKKPGDPTEGAEQKAEPHNGAQQRQPPAFGVKHSLGSWLPTAESTAQRRKYVWERLPSWAKRYLPILMSYVVTHAVLSGATAIALALLLYWMFRSRVISHAAATSSDVISDTLGTEQVKLQAEVLSKAVVERILNDDTTLALVVQLVVKVLQQPETLASLKELVIRVLQDPQMLEVTTTFFVNLMDRPELGAKVDELGMVTVEHTLRDPKTERELAVLFKDVFADKPLQMDVGRALWNATWYSVTPAMLTGAAREAAVQVVRVDQAVQTVPEEELWGYLQ
eukprot:GGOE01018557.1.p1 GENE.GGOE01018557.1~~GGOE01018557.1.p1  ORF type:complete len:342 (-),score=82.19 GGOE01018557.1:327-1268(-)